MINAKGKEQRANQEGRKSKGVGFAFLALIIAQAAHSAEEYAGRLWESFPPARLLPSLISDDLARGFLLLSIGLVTFGLWCFVGPVRREWPVAVPLTWGWVVVESINGVVHPLWALHVRAYTPGLVTAPILLILAINLAREQSRSRSQ